MGKNFKCACCVLSCVVSCALKAEAQEQSYSDSVLNTTPVYNDYNEMYKSSTHLLHGDSTRVGLVALDYGSTSGAFHKSQEGHVHNQLTFKAKGVATLNRVKVSGAFLFSQSNIDSMNNTMSGTFDHFIPYYFFATKHGKYERQQYMANTQIAYNIIPKRLAFGVGIQYHYNWMTRSVDPRPEVKSHELLLKPELIGKFGKHSVGVKYIWGYGSDYTTLMFKNQLFTQSLSYPDRIYYNNQGYGFVSIKDQFPRIYRTSSHQGVYFSYNYKGEQLDVHTSASWTNVYHGSSQTEAIKNRDINSIFDEHRWKVDGIATYNTKKNQTHQLQFDYYNRTGADWNIVFKANSYNAAITSLSMSYGFYQGIGKHKLLGGITYDQYDLMQSDAATSHSLMARQLTPGLFLGGIVQTAKINYNIKLKGSYTHPLDVSYKVPATQENVFSKNILYPDFIYYNTATVNYGAELKFAIKRLVAENSMNIVLQVENRQSVVNEDAIIPAQAAWIPTGNRWSFNVGVAINM